MSVDNVEDITPRVQYVAIAAQTDFDYPFPIFEDSDLVVDVDGDTKALSTDYTVTGEGEDTGGTVTFLVAMTGNEVVTIYRDIPIERTSDFQTNGPLRSATFNDELDKLTMILQQLESRIGRAVRIALTNPQADSELELGASFVSKYLFVNSSGELEPADIVTGTISQSIIAALLYPQTSEETSAPAIPTDLAYPPSVDERRFGAAFSGDPGPVAKVLASVREQDIPRIPVAGSVASAVRPLVSYEDKTIYVDPATGSDTNTGTISSKLATIQEAVNRCPLKLFHLYQINLAAGTYDEDVLVTGIECFTRGLLDGFISENFQIIGADIAPADPSTYKVGSLTVIGCHGLSAVKIQGVQMQRVSPYYENAEAIAIYGSGELFARNIAFVAAVGAASGAGIRVYGARGSLREINCDNVTNGVWAKRGALVNCSDFTGTPTDQAYRSEECSTIVVIADATTTGTDPRDKYVTNGGRIFNLNGDEFRDSREVAIGLPASTADALGTDAVRIGYNTIASSTQATAIGAGAQASVGTNNVALGGGAIAAGADAALAIGPSSAASGNRSVAIGRVATAAFDSSVAVGNGAVASAANRARLGGTSATAEVAIGYVVDGAGGFLRLKAPNGTAYKLTVSNAGALVITAD